MAQQITRLLRERGITAAECARRARVSRAVLTRWQRIGIARGQYAALRRVAAALDVPMEDLDDGRDAE